MKSDLAFPNVVIPTPSPYAQVTVAATSNEAPLARAIRLAFEDAMAERTRLPAGAFRVEGFSGRKFRMFLNALMGYVENPRYLEIGLYLGASFCSAISGNAVRAVGIDNWTWGNATTKDRFLAGLAQFDPGDNQVQVIDADFHTVDFTGFTPFNIYFYDGDHSEQTQYDAVSYPDAALDRQVILIVDDWNWLRVRRGTLNALRDKGWRIDYSVEVRTTFNNEKLPLVNGATSEWHNGCFAAVITRNAA